MIVARNDKQYKTMQAELEDRESFLNQSRETIAQLTQ